MKGVVLCRNRIKNKDVAIGGCNSEGGRIRSGRHIPVHVVCMRSFIHLIDILFMVSCEFVLI
jgi:hypothetical protein